MIDYTIFECEIEPTCGKGGTSPVPEKVTPSTSKDQVLLTIRKHLEKVYEVDRVLLWKMSHCTAYTQMTEILAGLRLVRKLECAIQKRLFEYLQIPEST